MAFAAQELKSYWTKDQMFGRNVFFEYVPPADDAVNTHFEFVNEAIEDLDREEINSNQDLEFLLISKHSRFGRYSIDFRKCSDPTCCEPVVDKEFARSLGPFNGFIPPLVPDPCGHYCKVGQLLSYTPRDLTHFKYPDMFMPSSTLTQHNENTCESCSLYFPVKRLFQWHRRLGKV
jgi:hypothetical protein